MSPRTRELIAKYLSGAPFTIEDVTEIPLTNAGKRKVVVAESY